MGCDYYAIIGEKHEIKWSCYACGKPIQLFEINSHNAACRVDYWNGKALKLVLDESTGMQPR